MRFGIDFPTQRLQGSINQGSELVKNVFVYKPSYGKVQ